jgi:hypothetical protein
MAARALRAGGKRYPRSSAATRVVRLLTIMRPESDHLRVGTGAAHTQVNCSYPAIQRRDRTGSWLRSVVAGLTVRDPEPPFVLDDFAEVVEACESGADRGDLFAPAGRRVFRQRRPLSSASR